MRHSRPPSGYWHLVILEFVSHLLIFAVPIILFERSNKIEVKVNADEFTDFHSYTVASNKRDTVLYNNGDMIGNKKE